MISKQTITSLAQDLGIPTIGIAPWPLPDNAKNHLHTDYPCPFTAGTIDERLTGLSKLDDIQSAIVCLFPYYMPHEGPTNLARYTWAKDYHLVVPRYLEQLGQALQNLCAQATYEIHCDTSPLADRYMAYLAGLGFYGLNRTFINSTWGSYTVIGTLLTNLPIEPDTPSRETCLGCKRCLTSCPGKALQPEDFFYHRCKSYITQQKGDLSEKEIAILQQSPLIFGCDICQEVCPHNAHIPTTPIPEFRDILPYIDTSEFDALTNREFKALYGDRSFSWRGKKILLRNHDIIQQNLTEEAHKK